MSKRLQTQRMNEGGMDVHDQLLDERALLARRWNQVQVSAEIAREIAANLALEELFRRVITLLKERFGYYHAQLLRYEAGLNAVVLAAGYGETGRKMQSMGYFIELGRGVVGTAASTGKTVLCLNTLDDSEWRADPLLPETRCEIAVPVKYGDRVYGVLDVQNRQVDSLTEDDQLFLEGVSSQLANAVEGAMLRQQMQERQEELNALNPSVRYDSMRSVGLPEGYVYDREDVKESSNLWSEEVEKAIRENRLVPPEKVAGPAVAPLSVRGEVIGALGVYEDPDHPLTPDEYSLVEQVSEQVALALESAGLFERTRLALGEAEMLYSFSRKLGGARDLSEILQSVVESFEIKDIDRAFMLIFGFDSTENLTSGVVRANWYSKPELQMQVPPVGVTFNKAGLNHLFSDIMTVEPQFTDEAGKELRQRGIASMAGLPLWTGSKQFGLIVLESSVPHIFTEEEKRPAASYAQQTAIAVQNRLLFEETQASEKNLSLTQQMARIGSWTVDIDSQIMTLSREHMIMMGLESEDSSLAVPVLDLAKRYVQPKDMEIISQALQRATENNDPDYQDVFEYTLIDASGSPRNLSVTLQKRKDNPKILIGTSQDITERKQTEQMIESNRRTLQAVLDNMPAGVFMVEAPSGKPMLSNRRAEEFLGRGIAPNASEDEHSEVFPFYRFGTDEIYPADEMPTVAGMFGQSKMIDDLEVRRPDGSHVLLQVNGSPVLDTAGNVVASVVVVQDISEARRAQETIAKRAAELATVAEVSTAVSTLQNPEEMLQTVVDLTKQAFNLYHAHIYLLNEGGDTLVLSKGAGEIGRQMVAEGRRIAVNAEKSLVARATRERHGVIVNDVRQEPDFLPHPLLPNTRSEMAVPMIVGGSILGVIDIQDQQVGRFTPEDVNIMTTLATQIAVSLQNARSYARAQRQAEREALINAISERIQSTDSIESALQVAVREIGRALGAQHTVIRLGLERKDENQ